MNKKQYELIEIDFSHIIKMSADHTDIFEIVDRVIQKAKQMLIEKLEDPENYQIVFEEPYINSVIGKLWAIRNTNV